MHNINDNVVQCCLSENLARTLHEIFTIYGMHVTWWITIPYSLYGNKVGGAGIQALAEHLPHFFDPQGIM